MTWQEAIDTQIRESGHDFRKLKCDYREVYWEKVAKIYAKASIEKDRECHRTLILKSIESTKNQEIKLP